MPGFRVLSTPPANPQSDTEAAWLCLPCDAGVQQPEVIAQALSIKTADGQQLFDCVQATWNLLEQSAGRWQVAVDR